MAPARANGAPTRDERDAALHRALSVFPYVLPTAGKRAALARAFWRTASYVPGKHQDHLLPRSRRGGMKALQDKARVTALHQFTQHPWKWPLREHATCELGSNSCCLSDRHRLHLPTGIADQAFGIHGEPTRLVVHDYPDDHTMVEAYVWTRNRGPLVLVYLDRTSAIGHPRLHGVYVDREVSGYLIGRADVIEEEAEASGHQFHGRLIDMIAEVYQHRRSSECTRSLGTSPLASRSYCFLAGCAICQKIAHALSCSMVD